MPAIENFSYIARFWHKLMSRLKIESFYGVCEYCGKRGLLRYYDGYGFEGWECDDCFSTSVMEE